MSRINESLKEQLALQLKQGLSYKDCLKQQLEMLGSKKRNIKDKKISLDNSEEPGVKKEEQPCSDATTISRTKPTGNIDQKGNEERKQQALRKLQRGSEATDIPCIFCDNVFSDKLTMKKHCEMIHAKLRYYCTQCSWSTKEKYGVKYHLHNKHDIPYEKSSQETVLECGICSYRGLQHQYENHILFVHPELDFTIVREKRERSLKPSVKLPKSCEFCEFKCKDVKPCKANMEIKIHVSGVHMKCRYKCDVCGYQSSRKQEVYRHIGQTHLDPLNQLSSEQMKALKRSKTRRVCPECKLEEDNFSTMLDHMKQQHHQFLFLKKGKQGRKSNTGEPGEFQCGECDYSNSFYSNLQAHMISLHLDSLFICKLCDQSFTRRKNVVTHLIQEHQEHRSGTKGWCRQFIRNICKTCDFEGTCHSYDDHITEVHKMPKRKKETKEEMGKKGSKMGKKGSKMGKNGSKMGKTSNSILKAMEKKASKMGKTSISISTAHFFKDFFLNDKCKFCASSAFSPVEQDRHMMAHHLKASYTCAVCGEGHHNRTSVLFHLRGQHQTQGTTKTLLETKARLRCGICPSQYEANPTAFQQHVDHHGAEFLEEQSQFQFCDLCDFKHVSKTDLKKHLASVHHLKPHKCSECDFDSKTLKGIYDHCKKVHPNFRFQCEKCEFSYTNVAALNRHVKDTHERIRWFLCTFCERKFKRKENLRDHSLRVHGSTGEY